MTKKHENGRKQGLILTVHAWYEPTIFLGFAPLSVAKLTGKSCKLLQAGWYYTLFPCVSPGNNT